MEEGEQELNANHSQLDMNYSEPFSDTGKKGSNNKNYKLLLTTDYMPGYFLTHSASYHPIS